MSKPAPAITLFVLAPLIGEFLLGNIAIDAVAFAVFLAPLYGGGALLIREVARRYGHGWPSIALLGVAYALIEEGLADQMFFNPDYDDLAMLERAYIPAWGTSAYVILASVTVHAIWSICVSIAIAEGLTPKRETTPWLGKTGFAITAAIYVAGAVLVWYGNYDEYHFTASPMQLGVTAMAAVAFIIAAFSVGPFKQPRISLRPAPRPWIAGAVSFIASGILLGFILDYPSPWVAVVAWFVWIAAFVALIFWWSRSQDWSATHRLAVGGGALLTYAWVGFGQTPAAGSQGTIDLIGNAVFASGAIVLLMVAAHRVRAATGRS